MEELAKANPRRRLGIPEDIAGVMVYLCSPAGSYMFVHIHIVLHGYKLIKYRNGVDISIDGGARLTAGRHSKI
jgi:NAD(P)-dependent dehydrogenase (short-subunit alcohol dehydrogenase family)